MVSCGSHAQIPFGFALHVICCATLTESFEIDVLIDVEIHAGEKPETCVYLVGAPLAQGTWLAEQGMSANIVTYQLESKSYFLS